MSPGEEGPTSAGPSRECPAGISYSLCLSITGVSTPVAFQGMLQILTALELFFFFFFLALELFEPHVKWD